MDYYITTQVNHEQYTVEKAIVAATVGAIGGAIGTGIVAPIAELAGATVFAGAMWVASPTTATIIGVTAELTTGAVLSAATNVVLSPAHREIDAYFEGEDLTWNSYVDDIKEHWTNDAVVGATSYALSTAVSEGLSTTFYPPQNVTQSILYSTMQGAGAGSSNTDLLDFALPDFNQRKKRRDIDSMKRTRRITSLVFLILLFLVQGVFLSVHKNMSFYNIFIYFGRILLIFLVPTTVVLLILFVIQFIRKKKGY